MSCSASSSNGRSAQQTNRNNLSQAVRPSLIVKFHAWQSRRVCRKSNNWGTRPKEKAAEAAASDNLISVVALPTSIDVPRTMTIRLTNAALYRPVRRTSIPCATATVIVIIMSMVRMTNADMNPRRVKVDALSHDWDGRSNCHRANKSQRKDCTG
jgi:hypothetical protein